MKKEQQLCECGCGKFAKPKKRFIQGHNARTNNPTDRLEVREKISRASKGSKNPMWGKPRSQEDKKKISEALKGRIISKEWRQKISEGMKGREISQETRKKLSKSAKKIVKMLWQNPEYRKHMSEVHKGNPSGMKGKSHSEIAKKKMREAHIGKKNSKETREKISRANSGKNHYNWQGGLSFEPYGIEFNDQLKYEIRKRDNYTCQFPNCEIKENGKAHDCHHINYIKKDNRPKNFTTLCVSCHMKTNYNREYWQNYFEIREMIL